MKMLMTMAAVFMFAGIANAGTYCQYAGCTCNTPPVAGQLTCRNCPHPSSVHNGDKSIPAPKFVNTKKVDASGSGRKTR